MSFQFVHMTAYSRKGDSKGRSTRFVFNEARRDPGASIHVQNAAPPVLVFGVGVDEVERLHDAAADAAMTTPQGGKLRRIQKTQHTLMTIVASHPYTIAEVLNDPAKRAEVDRWERLTADWLRKLYGDQLVSIIRHEDESHWHLHAYILPSSPDMKASGLHPGQCAKAAIMTVGPVEGEDTKALNKRGDQAYRAAMREWQDSYSREVGMLAGLTRLGPARRRLSRAEWQAEQVQARALRSTIDRATAVKVRGELFIATTKEDAGRIEAKAAAVKAEAERQMVVAQAAKAAALAAQDKAMREQRKARSMMSRARSEVAKLQRLPSMFRTLWDGFRVSSVQKRIRAAVSGEMDKLSSAATSATERAIAAEKARRAAEDQAANLRRSLADIGRQRDTAWQELAVLRPAANHPDPTAAPSLKSS